MVIYHIDQSKMNNYKKKNIKISIDQDNNYKQMQLMKQNNECTCSFKSNNK